MGHWRALLGDLNGLPSTILDHFKYGYGEFLHADDKKIGGPLAQTTSGEKSRHSLPITKIIDISLIVFLGKPKS